MCALYFFFFFFNDTATTEIYTLSLHDALPILCLASNDACVGVASQHSPTCSVRDRADRDLHLRSSDDSFRYRKSGDADHRSEEHTSELQSHLNLVCRLLLEKKNNIQIHAHCFL